MYGKMDLRAHMGRVLKSKKEADKEMAAAEAKKGKKGKMPMDLALKLMAANGEGKEESMGA